MPASPSNPQSSNERPEPWRWECDGHGRIDFLSPEFDSSTGLPQRLLLGQDLATMAEREAKSAQRDAIAAGKPFYGLRARFERRGGDVWVEMAGSSMADGRYQGIGTTVTGEIEAAAALRRSERRYRELFEAASDWFWETDADNRFVYISPNVESALGLSPASHYGKRLANTEGVLIELEAGRSSLAAIKARQPFENFIYSRSLPSGKTVWLQSNGAPYYAENGTFLGYRGITRDVTSRVEAEQALRQSQQQFRQVLEASADYYWEQDAQYRFTLVSRDTDTLFGRPNAEVIGKRLSEIPGIWIDPEMGRMALLAHKAKQPFRDFIYACKGPDGKKRWYKVSAAPIVDRDGAFLGYRGVGAEITRQVEIATAAGLAERRLNEAVAHVHQPIVVYDGEDRAVAFNQAFTDLHQVPDTNTPLCHGVPFRALGEWQLQYGFYAPGPDDAAVDLDTLLLRYQGEAEHTYHLRDGRWMLVVYRALPGTGRVGVWTDITALKEAEAERRALEMQRHHSQRLEALGTLAGGIAHEINNALVPVVALTKMAARKATEGSRERRNLDMVLAGAERSRDLVKQVLAFSHKEKDEQERQTIDVGEVLREALRMMRAMLAASIRLEEEISPTPPIIGDASQIQQVIVNLLTNAAQAIGQAQGSISVRLAPAADGGMLGLTVADTGCGMDEAVLTRIFEPFFTTKRVGEGTGLGLSVSHGIVKDHGGRIEVASKPGQGARFDVFLPTISGSVERDAPALAAAVS